MIYASFEAKGALEKPDVIGAVFGQTEGLLGSDMEMRELQKEGSRIGKNSRENSNRERPCLPDGSRSHTGKFG